MWTKTKKSPRAIQCAYQTKDNVPTGGRSAKIRDMGMTVIMMSPVGTAESSN